MSANERVYEIVLYGATGYTGQYTAEYIARNFPTNLVWALAGRSRDKLLATAKSIQGILPDRKDPEIEIAELDGSDLGALAKKTKCIINTVGPYCKYGEPVIKACAENGTHYVDATGESPWVRDMVMKYHDVARRNKAIIIPEIGLESTPADMLTFAVVKYLQAALGMATKEIILTTHSMRMDLSGGTYATVMSIFEVYSLLELARASTPSATCPIQLPKFAPRGVLQTVLGVRSVPHLGTLTTALQGASDTPIVYRSWGLLSQSGDSYGPNFKFSPFMSVRNAFIGVLVHLGLLFGPIFLAFWPARWMMAKFVYAPGQGPSREESERHSAEWRAIGIPDGQHTKKVFAAVRWQGSAYLLTGATLAEGARSILHDEGYPAKDMGGGILTPATLGQPYLDRLATAGFEVKLKVIDE